MRRLPLFDAQNTDTTGTRSRSGSRGGWGSTRSWWRLICVSVVLSNPPHGIQISMLFHSLVMVRYAYLTKRASIRVGAAAAGSVGAGVLKGETRVRVVDAIVQTKPGIAGYGGKRGEKRQGSMHVGEGEGKWTGQEDGGGEGDRVWRECMCVWTRVM